MSDNYGDVRDEAKELMERAIRLELDYQADKNADTDDTYTLGTDERSASIAAYKSDHEDEIAAQMSDIPGLFEPLADLPDPADFETLAGELVPALTLMAGPSGHDDFTDGNTAYGPHEAYDLLEHFDPLMDTWNGRAAIAFRVNFLAQMERVVWNQFATIAGLRGALVAEGELWEKARLDVSNMIDDANSALDVFEDSCDDDDVSLALGILGAIVGVAAVPFTGGTSAALGWAAASSAIAAAGSIVSYPSEIDPPHMSASSPGEVIDNLRSAITKFKAQIELDELFIGERCTEIVNAMGGVSHVPGAPSYVTTTDPSKADDYTLPRPALADSTGSNVNDNDHLGHST